MKKSNEPPTTKKPEVVIRERSTAAATRRAPRLPSGYYLSPEGAVRRLSSRSADVGVEHPKEVSLPAKGDDAVCSKASDAKISTSEIHGEATEKDMQLNSPTEVEELCSEPMNKKPVMPLRDDKIRRPLLLPSAYYLSPEGAVRRRSSESVAAEINGVSESVGSLPKGITDVSEQTSNESCCKPEMNGKSPDGETQKNSIDETKEHVNEKESPTTTNKEKEIDDLEISPSEIDSATEPINKETAIPSQDISTTEINGEPLPSDSVLPEDEMQGYSSDSVASGFELRSKSCIIPQNKDDEVFASESNELKIDDTENKQIDTDEEKEQIVEEDSPITRTEKKLIQVLELSSSSSIDSVSEPRTFIIKANIEAEDGSDSEISAAASSSTSVTPGICQNQAYWSLCAASPMSSQETVALEKKKKGKSKNNKVTPADHVTVADAPDGNIYQGKTLEEVGLSREILKKRVELPPPNMEEIIEYIRECIKEGVCVDIEILVGEKQFQCHWCILEAYSEYFKELTYKPQIALDEAKISPEGFELIYKMLTPDTRVELEHNQLMLVFQGANFLRIECILCECWSQIESNPAYNDLGTLLCYAGAKRLQIIELESVMLPRLGRVYLILLSTPAFLMMSPDDVQLLMQLNHLCVQDEIQVLLGAVLWLNHDWANRNEYATELIRRVRFTLLSPQTLVNLSHNAELELPLQRVLQDDGVRGRLCKSLVYSCMKAKGECSDKKYVDLEEYPRVWIMHRDGSKPSYCSERIQSDNQIKYWECFLDHLNIIKADIGGYYEDLVRVPGTTNADQKSA